MSRAGRVRSLSLHQHSCVCVVQISVVVQELTIFTPAKHLLAITKGPPLAVRRSLDVDSSLSALHGNHPYLYHLGKKPQNPTMPCGQGVTERPIDVHLAFKSGTVLNTPQSFLISDELSDEHPLAMRTIRACVTLLGFPCPLLPARHVHC